jgi:GNAT superfamily N-acetyltransferase
MSYDVVPYHSARKNQVAELHAHFWGDIDVSKAYLEWKYERNPYIGEPLIYLALHGDEPVGMRGMYGALWEAGSPPQRLPGLIADDLVVAPEHRNRGLITKIMGAAFDDLSEKGWEYLFSLSAGPVTRISSLGMGWRNVGPVGELRRVSGRWMLLRRLTRYMSRTRFLWRYADNVRDLGARHPFSNFRYRQTKSTIKIGPFASLCQEPRPEEMARLVERIPYDGRIRHVRDRAYFAWRFQLPIYKYWFLYWEELELDGYLVLQEYLLESMDRTRINIVDWEATSDRVRAGLLQAVLRLGYFPELRIWSATLPAGTKGLLEDIGFRLKEGKSGINDEQDCILVKPLREGAGETDCVLANRRLQDIADWDVRMIYSMRG